jgi:saccharopine dehydrogenase-like NADP-dependent oxidoreductase
MPNVLVTGAGKIGSLISCLLANTDDYHVTLADQQFSGHDVERLLKTQTNIQTEVIDITDNKALTHLVDSHDIDCVVSSLPYFLNVHVAEVAKACGICYFDLTEDTSVTDKVKLLAQDALQAFVPQCGLAPGFISITAHSLMRDFDELDEVKLRVGALPQHASNALQYALTWSTEGLINEYGNTCYGIEKGRIVEMRPLERLENSQLDGLSYEAFNTSGGLGSLAESYLGHVRTLNYKTIRYPGHCEKMRVLMNDLRLNEDRDTLKRILERAIPKTYQDVVIVYVSVTGFKNDEYREENYLKKIYPQTISGLDWSAIQVTTASGVCGVVDLVMSNPSQYQGLVLQEQFNLSDFLDNRFGVYYR